MFNYLKALLTHRRRDSRLSTEEILDQGKTVLFTFRGKKYKLVKV